MDELYPERLDAPRNPRYLPDQDLKLFDRPTLYSGDDESVARKNFKYILYSIIFFTLNYETAVVYALFH